MRTPDIRCFRAQTQVRQTRASAGRGARGGMGRNAAAVTVLLPPAAYTPGRLDPTAHEVVEMQISKPRALPVIALASVTLLAAGCGGSGKSRTNGASASQNPVRAAFRYSACMRNHGVANFPDPQVINHDGEHGIRIQAVGPKGSPQFEAAQKACQGILPALKGNGPQETAQQKRARLADALSFARCMRSNGVTRFPDPTAEGDLSVEMVQAQGIDVHSPAVLQVVQACLPASHGALTPAKVREALNNAGG
jgi:hypothetical protein